MSGEKGVEKIATEGPEAEKEREKKQRKVRKERKRRKGEKAQSIKRSQSKNHIFMICCV